MTNSTTNNTTTPGYTDGAPLTFVMTLTRTVGPDAIGGNADDGIALVATMTGTGLGAGNQGFLTQSATDSAPSGFVFDTFGLRPSTVADTATTFDTTNFKVEGPAAVPEPAFLGLAGSMGLILFRRRYRD